MKHLKTYNESLEPNIKRDLEDICQELKDEGFEIFITSHSSIPNYRGDQHQDLNYSLLTIIKHDHNTGRNIKFIYRDVEEVVERIKDYMSQQKYSTNVQISSGDGRPINNLSSDSETYRINLIFKNIKDVINESIDQNIKNDLEDICQELKDDGFVINIEDLCYDLVLSINKNDSEEVRKYKPFKFNEDIKEVVERIKDYMYSQGYFTNIDEYGSRSRLFRICINFTKIKKHKNRISESVDVKSVYQDIKDICLELEDEGFDISINHDYFDGSRPSTDVPYPQKSKFDIKIRKKAKNSVYWQIFDYSEISEVVERLKDYTSQNGFRSSVKVPYPNRNQMSHIGKWPLYVPTHIEIEKISDLDKISEVKIEFTEK